jgi:hypothetical protein
MNSFQSDKNKKLLFQILEKSNIEFDKSHVKEIVKGSFNKISNLSTYTNASLIQLNKKFIKLVLDENKKFNNNFLMSKDERIQGNMVQIQKKIEKQNFDMKSYRQKPPEEIDFKDKNWKDTDFGSIEDKISKTIELRKNDLEIDYSKKMKEGDFKNHSLWLSQKKKKNIKILNNIELKGTIQLRNGKKVRFEDDSETLKRKVSKLEKEVAEVKRQIREVLSERMMKKVI